MAFDSHRITGLYGIRNGYAIFVIGKGRNKRCGIIDREGKIVAELDFGESILWFSNERYIQCCTTASYNPCAACSIPKAERGFPSTQIESLGQCGDMMGFSLPTSDTNVKEFGIGQEADYPGEIWIYWACWR